MAESNCNYTKKYIGLPPTILQPAYRSRLHNVDEIKQRLSGDFARNAADRHRQCH